MENEIRVAYEDFSDFKLGAFPYDSEFSAMGEYHCYPEKGYKGNFIDPIIYWSFKGPSWLVTDPFMDGSHVMEQMRLLDMSRRTGVPTLRTGDFLWADYTVESTLRPMTVSEICGILFRYTTSLAHYGLFLSKNGVELHMVKKGERVVLAKKAVEWDADLFHSLKATVKGNNIDCFLDGERVFSVQDDTYKAGCVALSALRPTQYKWIGVTMSKEAKDAFDKAKNEKAKAIKTESESLPTPELWKKFDLKDFGAGRQLRFGHLTGTAELFFVICQNQKRVFKDRYPFISCMTAVSFESGKVLWQIGEPRDDEEVIELTTDLPFQVYDINGDGVDEVICSWDFKLKILDGRTGRLIKEIDTPINTAPPETVTGLEYGKYAFKRLNVDAIRIVNVSGKDRPSDIMIKDRYSRLWLYDSNLNFLWTFSKYNTGHFPYNFDLDGDGKDEIYSCYNMVDHDGKLLWSLPIETDHSDEIIVGKLKENGETVICIVSGWEGFMIVSLEGKILLKDFNGHGQRISIGNYIEAEEGLEICTTAYWGNNCIVYMHDGEGKELWAKEWDTNGNIIAPVNWDGSGRDLILTSADAKHGGLMNGEGDIVVRFPDDGHPSLCAEVLDITGDNRDEIIVWDRKQLWVYTPSGKRIEKDGMYYEPEKYPVYNASNYRGEFHFPSWKKIK